MRVFLFICLTAAVVFARGRFYREYWAEFDENISNHKDGRWRVNDPQLALHEGFGKRGEALANGLMLINAPEFLFDLESAELYLELWGGHPHTADKRVTVNGKGVYSIPDNGTSEGHCVYSYPSIDIEPSHLVNGVNALQYSCERGHGFWGHFIMDNAALRCFYKPDSLFKHHPELAGFKPELSAPAVITDDHAVLNLTIPAEFESKIESVDFLARYCGFDDNGSMLDDDWHGYTYKRTRMHHLGTVNTPPFQVQWDTGMIPGQSHPVQFKAIISFKDGLFYKTEPTPGSILQRDSEQVSLFYCFKAPIPFWSRAKDVKTGTFCVPIDPNKIIEAQLQVKIWDGGEGEVKNPFTLNGHAYDITSGHAIHDVVHSILNVDPAHLIRGENKAVLVSDTHHHGIEILRPGPALVIRYKK